MRQYQKHLKIILALITIATLFFIFKGIREKAEDIVEFKFRGDGQGMIYTKYDSNNKKLFEITCNESLREENDKMLMENIKAVIFKKGRITKNIEFFGDKGYFENNFYNFFIEKNARIFSEDFTISSKFFFLKDRAILTSDNDVKYKTSTLKGKAEKGMKFFLTNNTLIFYKTDGNFKRNEKKFFYQASSLWFMDKHHKLILKDKAKIRSKTSLTKGSQINISLDEENKNITETNVTGKAYLTIWGKKKTYKQFTGHSIKSEFDGAGRIKKTEILKNGRIIIKTENNKMQLKSDLIEILFEEGKDTISEISMPFPCSVASRGKRNFFINSNKMSLYFKNGDLIRCRSFEKTSFKSEEYSGKTPELLYELDKEKITLKGRGSKISVDKNSFAALQLVINIKHKSVEAKERVFSSLKLSATNPLFSGSDMYINSEYMKAFIKKEKYTYKTNVMLHQNDTEFKCKKLTISGKDMVKASGNIEIKFLNQDKTFQIRGKNFEFNSDKSLISVSGSGVLKTEQSILKGENIYIDFNKKSDIDKISGNKKIQFLKEGLSGSSDEILWNFSLDTIIFTGNAEIRRAKNSTTKGKILKLNLKNNKIVTYSDRYDRTKTTIK